MKITAIKPFVLSAGIFVKVETDAGIYGIGEAGMSLRGPAVAEVLNMMAPILVGALRDLSGSFFPGFAICAVLRSTAVIALGLAVR